MFADQESARTGSGAAGMQEDVDSAVKNSAVCFLSFLVLSINKVS